MIRFIDIGDQICEGNNDFAFYDTITDSFLTLGDFQTFSNLEELNSFHASEPNKRKPKLDRLISLIPRTFFNKQS